ncbi:MAG: hypothetical protein PUE08_01235 [Eubacteriales bacterium]|nr:hypothetical protein [Eubacteriales bacterium]
MKRPDRTHTKQRNEQPSVPEIQGKAKSGKVKAHTIIAGTEPPEQKVYHSKPVPITKIAKEKPISDVYKVIDNDLARDNLENDITSADLEDL